ncbi:hypothetical protein [Larkinella sp.]|uniref:hypothetical protein n=1 Tax=Larkinella sp. TaxID=2034517 RepID=UPI003BA9E771
MKVEIRVSENFKREARRLLKKFPSLQAELMDLQRKLAENPNIGFSLFAPKSPKGDLDAA